MARQPRPAATTSTLARRPDNEIDAEAAAAGTEPTAGAPGEQLEHPATLAPEVEAPPAAAQLAAAPEASQEPAPRRGRPRGPAVARAAAPAQPQAAPSRVQLTDQDLQDLGSLTRLSLKLNLPLPELAQELEMMLAAYRKAQL